GCEHQLGHVPCLDAPKFTGPYASLDDAGNSFEAGAHNFGEIELRDLGKVARFCEDQFRNARYGRRPNALPPAVQDHAKQVECAAVVVVDDAADFCDWRHQAFAHHSFKKLFFVREIQIESALADA